MTLLARGTLAAHGDGLRRLRTGVGDEPSMAVPLGRQRCARIQF